MILLGKRRMKLELRKNVWNCLELFKSFRGVHFQLSTQPVSTGFKTWSLASLFFGSNPFLLSSTNHFSASGFEPSKKALFFTQGSLTWRLGFWLWRSTHIQHLHTFWKPTLEAAPERMSGLGPARHLGWIKVVNFSKTWLAVGVATHPDIWIPPFRTSSKSKKITPSSLSDAAWKSWHCDHMREAIGCQ